MHGILKLELFPSVTHSHISVSFPHKYLNCKEQNTRAQNSLKWMFYSLKFISWLLGESLASCLLSVLLVSEGWNSATLSFLSLVSPCQPAQYSANKTFLSYPCYIILPYLIYTEFHIYCEFLVNWKSRLRPTPALCPLPISLWLPPISNCHQIET